MADKPTPSSPTAKPDDPLDLTTSVAGEEDPGASVDMANDPGRSDQPASQAPALPSQPQGLLRPGGQSAERTAATGETVCPRCGGSGKQGASNCPACVGTGRVRRGAGCA